MTSVYFVSLWFCVDLVGTNPYPRMKLSPIARRWLVSLLRYAAWGCGRSLITCLVFSPLIGFRQGSPEVYAQIIVIGAVANTLIFGLFTAISRKLLWLALPITGVFVPICLIPLPKLVECGRLWNCDPRLSGYDADLANGAVTIVWVLWELFLGFVATVVFALITTSRDESLNSGE
ncbi:MAG: hypothetical protein HZB53_21060 [Chloroflexi bacterium]|nr:hypothetical protein [Chloroflexota bacterium]